MTLVEIIQDIHGLEAELVRLEARYGLLSADFYHLYKAGELEQSQDLSNGSATMKPSWSARPAIGR